MKTMTEQQALQKLTFICAQGEHCTHEMKEKMAKWQLPEEAQTRCLEYLVKEKYVDDERYARFFINDKMKYNRWDYVVGEITCAFDIDPSRRGETFGVPVYSMDELEETNMSGR